MIYKPQIIIKCLSTQANYINRVLGQMFYYTDKNQVWYDTQNGGRILASDVYILDFERQRNNFIPNNKTTFATETDMLTTSQYLLDYMYTYVVETNSLYSYSYSSKTWSTIYGKYGQTTVAQTYLPDGDAVIVNADDVTTNGILNDGSVIVRDNNKMICGQFSSDGYTLSLRSLIGGQMNLFPSGSVNGNGCLQLNSESEYTNLNNNLLVFGNINTTLKDNWNKQYRLVTQDISIVSYTNIKKGSTISKNSLVNSNKYTEDTIIDSDIETNTEGLITTGSKLYINSVINNEELKPPYLFDINIADTCNLVSSLNYTGDVSIENKTLKLNTNSPFSNTGDCVYINIDFDISSIESVSFSDKTYIVDYIAKEGITNSAKICYYANGLKVKILP